MYTARTMIAIALGDVPECIWRMAASQEWPVSGDPIPCSECPLRAGGEWEAKALATIGSAATVVSQRFGCHCHEGRPCAGARRIANLAGTPEVTR